jgi:Tol biopolymer transport system component
MGEPDGSSRNPREGHDERLDSWKKIASYLKRDVTTVQRWERREAMPVHRHVHDKLGSVYAFRSELDAWRAARGARLADAEAAPHRQPAALEPQTSAQTRPAFPRSRLTATAAAAAVALVGAIVWYVAGHAPQGRDAFADVRVTRLTDYAGLEQAAAISRDGRLAAFESDRDGPLDVWVTTIGSGQYRNLTGGRVRDFVNPAIRVVNFSPDGALVAIWTRSAEGSRPEDINLIAVPSSGGPAREYLHGAAEFDWTHDGQRLVFHTTAPGDPLYVQDRGGMPREIYRALPGVHCHFPLWSFDGASIYFVRGVPPERWDIWRIAVSGGAPERITHHDSLVSYPVILDRHTLAYLAEDADGSGQRLYEVDLDRHEARRVSFGLERYTSLSASADGKRLLLGVSDPRSELWRVPLGEAPAGEAARVALVTGTARSPRVGPGYLLYVSESAGRGALRELVGGANRELWSDPRAGIVGAPAIAPDGRHIAFAVQRGESIDLNVIEADGGHVRVAASRLALRGGLTWDADGRSIIAAVDHQGEPRLSRIPLDGRAPSPLVAEYSLDPAYSPDRAYLVYSGADIGTTFPLRAAAADGRPYPLPSVILTRGARRVVLLRDGRTLVVLRGEVGHKDFWRIDIKTGSEQRLTQLPADFVIRDFDVAPDGSEIVFDRLQESSHIALIERQH